MEEKQRNINVQGFQSVHTTPSPKRGRGGKGIMGPLGLASATGKKKLIHD